jgi:hypothetical protein
MTTPSTPPSALPSTLCIPRADASTCASQVKSTFERVLGAGSVLTVTESNLRDARKGVPFKRYFVRMREWPAAAERARQRLLQGASISIVYAEPWFWRCSAAREPSRTSSDRP